MMMIMTMVSIYSVVWLQTKDHINSTRTRASIKLPSLRSTGNFSWARIEVTAVADCEGLLSGRRSI